MMVAEQSAARGTLTRAGNGDRFTAHGAVGPIAHAHLAIGEGARRTAHALAKFFGGTTRA